MASFFAYFLFAPILWPVHFIALVAVAYRAFTRGWNQAIYDYIGKVVAGWLLGVVSIGLVSAYFLQALH